VRELEPGEVSRYTVVRVADEVIVDLMRSACGITYDEAKSAVQVVEVDGVPIPVATPSFSGEQNKQAEKKTNSTYVTCASF
jgi:hypothetical protein